MIRKATAADLPAVVSIYDHIHAAEDAGKVTIGWITGVYPVQATAHAAFERDDLFVFVSKAGEILATAIINRVQVDVYAEGRWKYEAPEGQVMVLHTLIVDPSAAGRGIGREFVSFYELYALQNGCRYLRMDTNEKNKNARAMYAKLGFTESDTVPCTFNGIPDVQLVLLEKKL